MSHSILKKIFFINFILLAVFSFMNPINTFSAGLKDKLDVIDADQNNIRSVVDADGKGLNTKNDVPHIVANLVKLVLGLFGVISLIFIVTSGVTWMTSKGDAAKINKARLILTSAAIGMFIVAISYAATEFIINQITVVAK